jgi:TolB-like protein
MGFRVWSDAELPAHRAYADVIEERLRAARAVVVLWSADAVQSQWVRAEANVAREAGRLVQARLDHTNLPLPYNEIQCADCTGWDGDPAHPGWRKVAQSVASLLGVAPPAAPPAPIANAAPAPPAAEQLLAVLPFDNLSGDADTGYFSDGVSEEILHTVSRVRGLRVIGKASSFQFRGADKSIRRIVQELRATCVLDGSVRRAGERVRITAQLVDTAHAGNPLVRTLRSRPHRHLRAAGRHRRRDSRRAERPISRRPRSPSPSIRSPTISTFRPARSTTGTRPRRTARVALSLLEQAVARAPGFAVAWGQLALFRGLALPKESERAGDAQRPVIRSEAEWARTIDPDCGLATPRWR